MKEDQTQMPAGRARPPRFAPFSFIALYCWYTVYIGGWGASPVSVSLQASGLHTDDVLTVMIIGIISGMLISLFRGWSRIIEEEKLFKFFLYLCAFLPFQLFPLVQNAWQAYLLGLLGGFCLGAVAGQALYATFFLIIDIPPARALAAGCFFVQIYAHISAAAPVHQTPALYYAIEALTLLAGLLMSYFRPAAATWVRHRLLPTPKPRFGDTWAILAVVVLIQLCLTLYDSLPLPRMPGGFIVQIIPNAVALSALWLFGRRVTAGGALLAFIVLFSGGCIAFMAPAEEGRIVARILMEPACLLADLLIFFLIYALVRTCGHRPRRMKAWLVALAATHFTVTAAVSCVLSGFTTPMAERFMWPGILLIAVLVSPVQRLVKSEEARQAYAESHEETEANLPTGRPEVLEAREVLLRILPPGVTLTEEEQTALAYLIDGAQSDIMAHFSGLSLRRAASISMGVAAQFGFRSNAELLIHLGKLLAGDSRLVRISALFDRHGLTEREREICTLLLTTTDAQKHIADRTGLTGATVKFHIKNLYRKMNVQSRAELTAKFGGYSSDADA